MFDTGGVPHVNSPAASTRLSDAVAPASTLIARDDRLLPTVPALRPLLPDGGLRRGSTINVQGTGVTSLAFALLAEASAAGAWCAAVGLNSLGLLAAHHTGLTLSRMVLVPDPGPDWPTIVAALLDAFEIVVLRPTGPTSARLQQRLTARIRERDRVLVTLGADAPSGLSPDVRLIGTTSVWEGLGWGFGHLRSRQLQVRAEGRRLAGRPRHATVWLPDPDGNFAGPGPAKHVQEPRRRGATSTLAHLQEQPLEASSA
jgi:hypothetical protein